MARSKSSAKTLLTFNHPTKVTVRQSKFKVLDSLRHLDVAALSKAAQAEVELGEVETACCHHLVRAVIRKGMVTALNVEPLSKKDQTPLTPELRRLVESVKRKLQVRKRSGVRLPMPVKKFFSADIADMSIIVITCIQICFFGWCIACCFRGDIAICGKVTIDTTKLPYPE